MAALSRDVPPDVAGMPFDPRDGPADGGEGVGEPGGRGLPLVRRPAEIHGYRRLPAGWNRPSDADDPARHPARRHRSFIELQ